MVTARQGKQGKVPVNWRTLSRCAALGQTSPMVYRFAR
jgi:hypothetical protein